MPSIQIAHADNVSPKWGWFEVRADASHVGVSPWLYYNPLLTQALGVSVDLHLTAPDGTTRKHPGFYDKGQFKFRYSLDTIGNWTGHVSIRDKNGTATSSNFEVECTDGCHPNDHGWLYPSTAAPHILEHADGTPYPPLLGISGLPQAAEADCFGLCRAWANTGWTLAMQGGFPEGWDGHPVLNPVDYTVEVHIAPGQRMPWKSLPGIHYGRRYRVSAEVRSVGITNPGPWLGLSGHYHNKPLANMIAPVIPGTSNWHETVWEFVPEPEGDRDELFSYWWLANDGTDGELLARRMSLYLLDDDGNPVGENMIAAPSPNPHMEYRQNRLDEFESLFKRYWDVRASYLLALFQHEDPLWYLVFQSEGGPYGPLDPNHPMRLFQEGIVRTAVARWGWSPWLVGFEYVNEGDPDNGFHFEAVKWLGTAIDKYSSRPILAGSSWWGGAYSVHSVQPEVGWTDTHTYVTEFDKYGINFNPAFYLDTDGNNCIGISNDNPVGQTHAVELWPIPVRQGHTYQIRYKCKGVNLSEPYQPNWSMGPSIEVYGTDAPDKYIPNPTYSGDAIPSPAGTWPEWVERETSQFTINHPNVRWIKIRMNNNWRSGTALFDDFEIKDVTLEESYHLVANGDFENVRSMNECYPLLQERFSHSRLGGGGGTPFLTGSIGAIGETAIGRATGTPEELLEASYNGGEDPRLKFDTRSLWLRSMLWSSVAMGSAYPIGWSLVPVHSGTLYPLFRTYRRFLRGLTVNNGQYVDLRLQNAIPDMLIQGQVDYDSGNAHFYATNLKGSWLKNVNAEVFTNAAGTANIPLPDGDYKIERWDTLTGIKVMEDKSTVAGNLAVVLDFHEDVGVKIYPADNSPPEDEEWEEYNEQLQRLIIMSETLNTKIAEARVATDTLFQEVNAVAEFATQLKNNNPSEGAAVAFLNTLIASAETQTELLRRIRTEGVPASNKKG